jgi:GNAT superfamily N-acetyltransferase
VIFAALSESADRGELLLVQDGLCRYRLRRDGTVVVRELLVLPFRRRTGLGSRLVAEVRARHPGRPIEARCPAGYASNAFWAALGFTLASAGEVNLWRWS